MYIYDLYLNVTIQEIFYYKLSAIPNLQINRLPQRRDHCPEEEKKRTKVVATSFYTLPRAIPIVIAGSYAMSNFGHGNVRYINFYKISQRIKFFA